MTILRILAVVGGLLLIVAGPLAADDTPRKPNIVILLADDLGFADAGFQGCQDIPTPNIDSLAKSGVRCTNGYVSGPYCSPTRAGLLTGRYQTRFGHEFNPGGGKGQKAIGLPLSETTVADRLKAAGYVTGLVGKWHLGTAPQFHPQQRGFAEFFGFLDGAHAYFPGKGADILRGTTPVDEREYLTDALAREAVAFIDRNQGQPFFLDLAFNAVHTPMHATDARLKRFESIADSQRRTYAAMLTAMDEAIGQVLDKLRSAGLEENTLIFFFSDNGGPTMVGTTMNGSRNTPLRGSKRTTLEGGIHVPFVVQWKGKLPAGTSYAEPVIQLDVQPTALAAAGIDVQSDWKLDGVNLLPFLAGQKAEKPHEVLFWRFGEQMAVRKGDWKLVSYDAHADGGARAGEGSASGGPDTPRKKKKRSPGATSPRLYNLADDIGESQDQSTAHPDKATELRNLWDAWNREMVDPLW